MKKYTILFLLAFLTGPALGQIMKGFVYDKETNSPLGTVVRPFAIICKLSVAANPVRFRP